MTAATMLLLGAAFVSQSSTACPGRPVVHVELALRPDTVSVLAGPTLAELKTLYDASGQNIPHAPLGFYERSIRYIIRADNLDSGICADQVNIGVTLILNDRHIVLAREVMQHACLREAAVAHYRRHAAANDGTFVDLVGQVRSTIADPTFLESLRTASASRAGLEAILKPTMDDKLRLFRTEDRDDQAAVDTPHEVQLLEEACSTPT